MSTVLGRHDRAKEASGASWLSWQKPTIEDFPFDKATTLTNSGDANCLEKFSLQRKLWKKRLLMSHIQKIKDQIKLRYKREAAAKAVLNGEKNLQDAAKCYGIDKRIVKRKIILIRKMGTYYELKFKYEAAVKECLSEESTIEAAADLYNISEKVLMKEIRLFLKSHSPQDAELYVYDRPIERAAIFTISEEISLLKDLLDWKEIVQPYCFCLLCAMEQLLNLANQYVKSRERIYSRRWHESEVLEWLLKFEMRSSTYISTNFRPNCIKGPTETEQLEVHDRGTQANNFEDKSTQTDQESENEQPLDLTTKEKH